MENVILEILEEIKTKQAEQSKQLTKLSKPNELPHREPPEPQTVNHVHRLELKTSMWLIVTVGLLLLLIGSTVLNYNQYQAIRSIEVNDLKYRYIKMKGEIATTALLRLDTISEKELKQLRNDVETYEHLIQEQAGILVRTHTLQQQTKQLKER